MTAGTQLAREVAERYGTPAYVYDLADIRRAHAELTALLPPGSLLYYSLKANPHPAVCGQLAQLGCGAEVSSAGEIETCVAAGFPPGRCLITGPGKSEAEIRLALARGIRDFSVDSPGDLRRVAAAAAAAGTTARCLLRVNPDTRVAGLGLSMTGVASQFGADAAWVRAHPGCFTGAGGAGLAGLHVFMGSNADGEETLLRQFEVALDTAADLAGTLGIPRPVLDLGGGFGAPYARPGTRPAYPGLAAGLAGLLARPRPVPDLSGGLAFESGRFLAGGCGTLVTRVVDVKESKGSTFVVLDSGVNHLGGMAGLRRVPRVGVHALPADASGDDDGGDDGGGDDGGTGDVPGTHLVGPLCTPLDHWARGVTAPRLSPGDLVMVPNTGAYGLTASLLAFLSHPPALEVVADGGRILAADRLTLTRQPADPGRPVAEPAHPGGRRA